MNIPKKVLLIDHSSTALAIISRLIIQEIDHVTVDIQTSSIAALDSLKLEKYDLITMSRNLPDMECEKFIEKIRIDMHIRHTPIIVISGQNMGALEEQVACHYVNGYFDKNLGQEKLVEYIKSFLTVELPSTTRTGNILYVEDSPTVAQVVKSMLTKHGHNYLFASNAEEALDHLRRSFTGSHIQPFDLLLTDIQLEGHMSGTDLMREVRHGLGLTPEQLPILVTTSNNENNDKILNQIFAAGANDLLEKPVQEALFIARMNNLLRLRHQYLIINS
ncbi:MAG: response regulator [Gammaproteobacteria bacterium]|nr:response regulator [Gammaproteobacteria bacterium]